MPSEDANVKLPHRPEVILGLGVLGLMCGIFTGIPAAIMGGRTVRFIDQAAPHHPGRGLAKAGQILGIISTITGIFVCLPATAAIIIPVFAQARLAKKKTDLLKHGADISLGLQRYIGDHDARLPLQSQWKGGAPIKPYLEPKVDSRDFVYTFSGKTLVTDLRRPSMTPLGHLPGTLVGYNRQDVVVFADGHTSWVNHNLAEKLENNKALEEGTER